MRGILPTTVKDFNPVVLLKRGAEQKKGGVQQVTSDAKQRVIVWYHQQPSLTGQDLREMRQASTYVQMEKPKRPVAEGRCYFENGCWVY